MHSCTTTDYTSSPAKSEASQLPVQGLSEVEFTSTAVVCQCKLLLDYGVVSHTFTAL